MYEILTNALFQQKLIQNISKMITKDKKTYTKKYKSILVTVDQFLGFK